MDFYQEIISLMVSGNVPKGEINKLKNRLARKHGLKRIPTDIDIALHASPDELKRLDIVTKPTRTLSGVAPIALMTAPHKCPHGTCLYCPGGPGSIFGDVPQSYTGKEPSTMRSIRNRYDPYLVVFNRLEQYVVMNQSPQKVEIIIQGGTFPAMEADYKRDFVTGIYKALNDFSEVFYADGRLDIVKFRSFFELPGDIKDREREVRIQERVLSLRSKGMDLEEEKTRNETAAVRCVGFTIETKPDWGLLRHGLEMLDYGCTRVELGIQATDEAILRLVNRGHSLQDSKDSTRILKDLGFKINYHMMPGLPSSTPDKDLKMLVETLEDPDFRPDMYKIYPTMVMAGTGLEMLWKKGVYKPITTETAARTIALFKRHVPRWIRIMRVQRDIPTKVTEAGVDRTNLRQYVLEAQRELGIECQCIRCREAGLASRTSKGVQAGKEIFVEEYEASCGKEFFISCEDSMRKVIYGYCRLRFPSQSLVPEITPKTAIIRELHVVGTAAGIGEEGSLQHKGIGRRLLLKAEEIASSAGMEKVAVISGIGVREYYSKLGYSKDGHYMSRSLSFIDKFK